MAKLNVRIGAMESVKTTEALAIHHNYRSKGHNSVLAKPLTDTKDGDFVSSRPGLRHEADIIFAKDEDIRERLIGHAALKGLETVHVLIVDEANFVTPEQAIQLHALTVSDNYGLGEVPVIAFGLRSSAMGEPFMGVATLLAFAKDIEIKKTICRCATTAWHNTRKIDGKFVFEGEQVAIDGEVENGAVTTYESLCSDCYTEEVNKALAAGEPVQASVMNVMGISDTTALTTTDKQT